MPSIKLNEKNVDQYVCSECNDTKKKSNPKINYDLSKNIIK